MTLDDIFSAWEEDSRIDPLDLGGAALNIPLLHSKYLRYLSGENRDLRKLESSYKKLVQLKIEYFGGFLNGTDELTKLGWGPFTRKVLKSDIQQWVDSDPMVVKLTENIGEQKEKVSILTSILREVSAMSFNIKSGIEWRKFTEGAM